MAVDAIHEPFGAGIDFFPAQRFVGVLILGNGSVLTFYRNIGYVLTLRITGNIKDFRADMPVDA
jgi:hypothetical protein